MRSRLCVRVYQIVQTPIENVFILKDHEIMALNFTETENLAADIRNKLTPFWNLVALNLGDFPGFDIKAQALLAQERQQIILNNLDEMIRVSDRLHDQIATLKAEKAELQADLDEIFHTESPDAVRVYDQPITKRDRVYDLAGWEEAKNDGIIMDSDGIGYWVKDGKYSRCEVFCYEQRDATHVIWFNK